MRDGIARAAKHAGPGFESNFVHQSMVENFKQLILETNPHEEMDAATIEKMVKKAYVPMSNIFK